MLDIGISVGALIIVPLANTLADNFGWRVAYHVIGLTGAGFLLLWQWLGAEDPQSCTFITEEELRFLQEYAPKKEPKKANPTGGGGKMALSLGMPTRDLLHPAVLAIFVAHMAFNYGAYFMTNWNPIYYKEVLGLSPAEAKWYLSMPHVLNLASKALNPALIAVAERRGVSLLRSRQLFTGVGFLGAALAVLPIHRLRGVAGLWFPTLLFSLANTFFGLAPCGFKSNYLDVTDRYVGVLSGRQRQLRRRATPEPGRCRHSDRRMMIGLKKVLLALRRQQIARFRCILEFAARTFGLASAAGSRWSAEAAGGALHPHIHTPTPIHTPTGTHAPCIHTHLTHEDTHADPYKDTHTHAPTPRHPHTHTPTSGIGHNQHQDSGTNQSTRLKVGTF